MALFDMSLDQLQHYRPDRNEPEDFDAFWQHTLTACRQFPLNATFEPIDFHLRLVETFMVVI